MLEYLDFCKEDIDTLTEYYSRYLNDGEGLIDFIRTAAEGDGYFGSKAVENGTIVGFFTFQLGMMFTYPRPDLIEKLEKRTGGKKTVTVDTLVVLPEKRGKGVAGSLRERNSRLLKERGISFMLAESWIYPDGRVPSFRVYADMGRIVFEEKIPLFYKDLGKYGITCPICGSECRCGADILLTELTS